MYSTSVYCTRFAGDEFSALYLQCSKVGRIGGVYPEITVAVAPARAFGSWSTGGEMLSRGSANERFHMWPQSVSTRSTSLANELPTASFEASSGSPSASGSKPLALHAVDARPPVESSSEPLAANECAAIAYGRPEPRREMSAR